MFVRLTRGMIVVTLLVVVNIQLLVLVLRSDRLFRAAVKQEPNLYTLATVTRELRGSMRDEANIQNPSETAPKVAPILKGIQSQSAPAQSSIIFRSLPTEVEERGASVAAVGMTRVQPQGRWVRLLARNMRPFELVDDERAALADAFGFGLNGNSPTLLLQLLFLHIYPWKINKD